MNKRKQKTLATSNGFLPWILFSLNSFCIKNSIYKALLDLFSLKQNDEIRSEGKKKEQISAFGSYAVGVFILLPFLVLFSSKYILLSIKYMSGRYLWQLFWGRIWNLVIITMGDKMKPHYSAMCCYAMQCRDKNEHFRINKQS